MLLLSIGLFVSLSWFMIMQERYKQQNNKEDDTLKEDSKDDDTLKEDSKKGVTLKAHIKDD